MAFPRITVVAEKMGGQPCIRGLRIPVATVVALVADGMTTCEILTDLPDLEAEDIAEVLRFAADPRRRTGPRVSIRPRHPSGGHQPGTCDRLRYTDFGAHLAETRATAPSMILVRRISNRRVHELSALILANLDEVAEPLEQGAVIVIEETRIRVRLLPLV